MKLLVIILCACFSMSTAFSQQYNAVDNGSEVKFSIKNFGLPVTGTFKGLRGKIIFDPADLSTAFIDVTVDAATVNTGNASRDKHLKKENYFDAAHYPELHFTSATVTGSAGKYSMNGQLTIKGISKQITFPFTASPEGNNYRFSGQFSINRRSFSVGGSSWVLSDDLTVSLNVSAIK